MLKYSKLFRSLIGLSFLMSIGAPALPALATGSGGSISLSASKSTVASGGTVVIAIYMNGGGNPINAVEADFTYPESTMQYVGINYSGSAFSIAAPNNGGGSGLVTIGDGTTSPISGSALVATVTFRALANSGSANFAVAGSSNLVNANDNTAVGYSPSGTSVKFGVAAAKPVTPAAPATPKDTTAPKITNTKTTDLTPFGATVTWTTDEASDAVVEYGLDANYGLSASSTTSATTHSVALNSTFLAPLELVHYRVKSTDTSGNVATGEDQTLQLPGVAVTIVVRGPDGHLQSGVSVTVDGASGTTNAKGEVTLTSTLGTKKVVTTYKGVTVQKSITIKKSVKPLPPYQLDLSRQPLNHWMLTSAGLVAVVLTLLGIDAVLFGSRLFGRMTRLKFAKQEVHKAPPKAFHLPALNHRLPKHQPLRSPAAAESLRSPAPVAEAQLPTLLQPPVPAPEPKPEPAPPEEKPDPMVAVAKLMGGPPPETTDLSPKSQTPVKTEQPKIAPTIGHFADRPASPPLVIDIKPLSTPKPEPTPPQVTRQTAPPLPAVEPTTTTISVSDESGQTDKVANVAHRLKKPAAKKHAKKAAKH
jgi:hypothetical protein